MAQEEQHVEEQLASLRKARREIDAKLDAALEGRSVWRRDEDDRKASTIKLENEGKDIERQEETTPTRSPSSDSRTVSRRGDTNEIVNN